MSDTDESALRDEWMKSFARPRKSTFSRDADGRYVNRFVEDDWQSYRRDNHPLAAAVLQQEAGEPVACSGFDVVTWTPADEQRLDDAIAARNARRAAATPQVSPPQARVPLTEEQIIRLTAELDCDRPGWAIRWARAIERAHLIGLEMKG